MSSQEFVAGAFVDVKPDPRGFRAELKRIVDNAIKNSGTFKVPIEVDPKRFKSTIQSAVRGVKAQVEISPKIDKAAFRREVKKQITEATQGLKVTIPVEAGTAARATGTTGTGTAGAAGAAGAAGGVNQTTTATKKLTEAQKRKLAVDKALKTAQEQEAIAQHLLTAAHRDGLSVEERAQFLSQARAASTKGAKAANEQLALSGERLSKSQKRDLENAAASASTTRALTTEKQKVAKALAVESTLVDKATAARVKAQVAIGVEVKGIKTLNELHLVENDLLAIEARLKAQTARARELNVAGIVTENEAMLAQIAAQKATIVNQRAFLKGEGVQARNRKTAARGGVATILSLLGVRGATLAANSAFLAGAAAVAIFAKSLGSFAKFETELNTFQAIAGATADQMAKVSAEAQKLGADITLPAVTAADAAQAMTELSRAGLGVTDSMAGARGVLELAAAAQISNAEAATLTASALNAFGLSGDKAVHVADLLANAANAAQGSIAEMGAAMQQASAIARQVGLSLDNTVAILTLFARNGLRGSDAGTSLRTALSRLIAPTKKAALLIDTLGLNIRDAQGNIRPDIFAQFGEATANISPALRDMISETIAGQDAIRAFAIGAREGAHGLRLAQLQMAEEGSAAKVAGARTKGLAGEFSALSSNTETLGIKLGQLASGPIKEAARQTNVFLTELNALARGDFGSVLDQEEKSFGQFARNMKRHGEGLKTIFFGPGSDLEDLKKGLGQLFGPAGPDPETARIEGIQKSIEDLNRLRVSTFDVSHSESDIKGITELIKKLQGELKKAQIDAGVIVPVTPLEKALAPLEEQKRLLEELKASALEAGTAPPSFVEHLLTNVEARIKVTKQGFRGLKNAAKDAVSGTELAAGFKAQLDILVKDVDLATPEVIKSFDDMIRKIKAATGGQGPLFTVGKPQGLLDPGNLDLLRRKIVQVGDSVATVRSISVQFSRDELPAALKDLAGKEVLIPTVFDGKALTGSAKEIEQQAVAHFLKTGEHLGAFSSVAFADAYAKTLHQQQAKLTGAFADVTRAAAAQGGQLSGQAGKAIALGIVKSAQDLINAAVAADDPELADAIKAKTDAFMRLFNIKVRESMKELVVPLTADELANAILPQEIATSRADAFGSVSDQIRTRQAELAKLNQQLVSGDVIKGSAQEKQILDAIAAKQSEINSLREGQASEAKEARAKSDQKVIDAMGPEEQKRQNALVVAQATESLADDIKREEALRDLYLHQIDTIPKTIKGDEARREALAEANQKLFSIEQDIARDRAARRQQIRDLQVGRLDEAAERAAETETLADDQNNANRKVAFWKNQVKIIKRLVRERKATADELRKAQDSLDEAEDAAREVRRDRRQQIADLKAERLDLRIQIAQDTGNKNAEIAARKLQIKNTEKLISQTKKGSIARLRLKAELARENKELKDLQDEVDEAKRGTTAFDILKEAAETFKETGGNLINGQQPFTGPSGFTADIAQWLRSQKSVSGTRGPQAPPIPPKLTITQRNDPAPFDRLVTALNANTAALEGKGNRPAAKKGVGVNIGAGTGVGTGARFWDSGEARRDGGGGTGGV